MLRVADGDAAAVDLVLDAAEQKGTGRWTAQDAIERGVPVTGITEAVFAGSSPPSATCGGVRPGCCGVRPLTSPPKTSPPARPGSTTSAARSYAGKVVAYAQGFEQLAVASAEQDWGVELSGLATIWRGGCIIAARFLDRVREAYDDDPDLPNPAAGTALRQGDR